MQLMHMLNCRTRRSARASGGTRALAERLSRVSRMIQGLTSSSLCMKSSMSTTRSRMTGKLASGSTRIVAGVVVAQEGGAGQLRRSR